MDIRINGSANFSQVSQQITALRTQVAALNAELARTGVVSSGVNPAGYRQMQTAMRASSMAYRDAAASSGQFLTQQVRLNSATEDMTKRLAKQKVGLTEMWRERKRLTEVYREQVRLQNMYVREAPSMSQRGRGMYDIAVPRQVSSELNTVNSRLAFANALIKSASTQMVNWGKNTQWAGRQLMVGFTVPMAAFGAAAGVLAYQVDKEMTRIMKVYDTTAQVVNGDNESMKRVEQELGQLRVSSMNTAMKASKEYGASAKDTLALQAELAATGLKGEALQTSTNEAMRIATLGELDYQQAADTTIALQTAFKLSTKELTEAFNFMNATENATSLSIQDIAEATPRAASAMSALGVSVEEMTVLLVSMREAGVDAAEGANALKSATGTILAPSPAADKFIKQISNGKVQVTELAEASNGNLYKALQLLSEEMNGLSKLQKQQILVKLFGKYQFNRVSAMLYNLSDAVNGVGNQTKTAMDLMGNSAAENAATAERELGRFQKSLSGRFKIGLETFKNEMSKMGEPFLEIGIAALKTLTILGKFFNSLPSGTKKVIAFGAIALAIAGPITMLVGLFANMIGTLTGFARAAILFGNRAGLVTKESKAMELASRTASAGWDRQTTAVQGLTRQLEILTAAQMASQRAASGLPMVTANGNPLGSSAGNVNVPITNANHYAGSATAWSAPTNTASNVSPQQQAYLNAIGAQMTSNLRVQEDTARAAAQEAQNRQRTQKFLAASAASAGVMALAMGTMAVSSNKTVDQFAGLALTAALIIPLLNTAIGSIKTMVAARLASRAAMAQEAAATQARIVQQQVLNALIMNQALLQGGATAAAARGVIAAQSTAAAGAAATGRFAALRIAMQGGLKSVTAMMGPVGWLITGGLILGGIWWKIRKDKEKARQELEKERKIQADLVTQSDRWASNQSNIVNSYRELKRAGSTTQSQGQFREDVKFFQSDGEKDKTDQFNKMEGSNTLASGTEAYNHIMLRYIDNIKKFGLSVKESKTNITAFLYASGMGLSKADQAAQGLVNTFGNLKKTDWQSTVSAGMKQITQAAFENNDEEARNLGMQAGQMFAQGLLDPDNTVQQRQAYFKKMKEDILTNWEDIANELKDNTYIGNEIQAAAQQGGEALREYYLKLSPDERKGAFDYTYGAGKATNKSFSEMADNADKVEQSIVRGAGAALGMEDSVNHMGEMFGDPDFFALTADFETANKKVDEIANKLNYQRKFADRDFNISKSMGTSAVEAGKTRDAAKEAAENQALLEQNAINSANKIKIGANYQEAWDNWVNKTRVSTKELEGAAFGAATALSRIDGKKGKEILQNSINTVRDNMAAQAEQNFDNRMSRNLDYWQGVWDNRIEGQENAQEAESDAMQERHERQMDKFEARWEKRKDRVTDYWDNRIKAVDNAIKAEEKAEDIRQSIFDAEMKRLDRLNEATNRNIDFNVALNSGNFDEAAKIRNDAEAQFANYALEDAAAASGTRSENRVDSLQNKSDRLSDQRDKALEALEKIEEAERKSLEKRQQAEEKHLDKLHEARSKDLKRRADADIKQRRENWELDRIAYNQRLELFKSYNGRSIEEVMRWANQVGFKYEEFGDKRLKPMGQTWAQYFREQLKQQIGKAGVDVASSGLWEEMSGKEAKSMLRAFGFNNMGQLRKFMNTGKLMDASDSLFDKVGGFFHTGGEIGKDKGGRNGVARTQRGLGPGERPIIARDGEFMLDKKTYQTNKGLVQNMMNSKGPVDPSVMPRGVMGGFTGGQPALYSSMMWKSMMSGMGNVLASQWLVGADKHISNMQKNAGFGSAGAGMYGDVQFSAEQLNNARTIANVGRGMGMSSRDIQIGIMTAIAESMLRNLRYGDRDSQGLFQQRPSQGWGSIEQVTNPEYSSRKFFETLRGVGSRNDMAPWLAAQAVQRSAYSDGSNYRQYWDEAQAIFKTGLTRTNNNLLGAFGAPGSGGRHRPVNGGSPGGLHDTGTDYPGVDIALPTGTPVYAVGNGTVTKSSAYRGYEPRRVVRGQSGPGVQDGYRSYGRYMILNLDSGPSVIYAHLSAQGPTGRVTGGTQIGKVGNTGYVISSRGDGSHLHFGSSDRNPLQFMAKGGTTSGEGLAYLHDSETVLSKPLSSDLQDTVKALGSASRAMGGKSPVAPQANRNASITSVINFARDQVGKPYIWGGEGPDGYDCSGMQSTIINVIKGREPRYGNASRLFATASMSSALPRLGFKNGQGGKNDYSVGWYTGSPGHTSGRIGDYGIESTGSRVRGGSDARSVSSFPNQMHLPMSGSTGNPVASNPSKGDKPKPKPKRKPFKAPKGVKVNTFGDTGKIVGTKANILANSYLNNNVGSMFDNSWFKKNQGKRQNSAGGNVRTATMNFDNIFGDNRRNEMARLMKNADVMGLSDYSGDGNAKNRFTNWIMQRGWGFYGNRGDTPIIWNKNKFKAGERGYSDIPSGANRISTMNYVKLSGASRPFWAASVHTAAHTSRDTAEGAAARKLQPKQYAIIRDRLNKLEKSAPVMLMGDFNEDVLEEDTMSKLLPGYQSNWRKGVKRPKMGTLYDRFIDQMFTTNDFKLLGSQLMGIGGLHGNASLAQYNLPAFKNGGFTLSDGMAMLHDEEVVLDAPMTEQFRRGVDNFANGGGNVYHNDVKVYAAPGMSEEALIKATFNEMDRRANRLPKSRKGNS